MQRTHRQAHHIVVVALNSTNEHAGAALNTVCPRFVHWFSCGNITCDLILSQVAKIHLCALGMAVNSFSVQHGKPRIYLVAAAGQGRQHVLRIRLILRLTKNSFVQYNDGIRPNNNGIRPQSGNLLRFLQRQMLHQLCRCQSVRRRFFPFRRQDFKFGNPHLPQQFPPPRRAAGQYNGFHRVPVLPNPPRSAPSRCSTSSNAI